jgi:hypothetical protein
MDVLIDYGEREREGGEKMAMFVLCDVVATLHKNDIFF